MARDTLGLEKFISVAMSMERTLTGYAGFGKIHFRGDVDGAYVAITLLQDQYRLQIIFAGFQKHHNYFLLTFQR